MRNKWKDKFILGTSPWLSSKHKISTIARWARTDNIKKQKHRLTPIEKK